MARPFPQSALRFPVSTFFGSESNVRVLRELARHGGQLSVSTLVRRANLSQDSVRLTLISLVAFSIVQQIGSGKARLYQLNNMHVLSEPIVSIFRAEEHRFAKCLDSIRECAASFGQDVVAAWIYGSTARGEDRPDSDLDIVFVSNEAAVSTVQERGGDILIAAGDRLAFSPSLTVLTAIDLTRLKNSNDPLWLAFVNEALHVYGIRIDSIA